MRPWLLSLSLLGIAESGFLDAQAPAAEKTAAERGRDILFHQSLNPALWSTRAYDDLWKQWGLAAKPADYEQALRDRYGLQPAPFDNHGRLLGLIEARGLLGKGIINNCLLCHAGTVAGQTIIGLPNASLDLQTLFEDLSAAGKVPLNVPFRFSYVRGTIDPLSPAAFLLQFRDSELNVKKAEPIPLSPNASSDPPAWWLLKKKKTRDWTGIIDARSKRIDMVNVLSPMNSGAYVRQQEAAFDDISAFILSVEAPKYPFPVDDRQAARGKELFGEHCAKCHGTYGPGGSYPNKVVALDTIGTDRVLAEGVRDEMVDLLNRSWLAREIGGDGKPIRFQYAAGYQAPPLDGIWATAPYFHNGSAPTVYHVLNPKARPKYFTRSYRTEKEDYDPVKLGWKIIVLDKGADPNLPGFEQRKIYDTTRPGQANTGHNYGDKLSEDERLALIEYVKTL
jgi:mono/diheme cytochrome c family protein